MNVPRGVVRQVEGNQLVATADTGHSVVLHALREGEEEWKGFSPMQLVLLGAGGCTALDVIQDLRKMRQPVERVEVHLESGRAPDPPHVFTWIRITYVVWGNGVRRDRVERAIELSQEKYCSATIMLKRAGVEVEWDLRLEDGDDAATQG